MKGDVEFYSQLWERLVTTPFSAQKLADRVRVDGGIDIDNLSETQVLDLIEGRFEGPWSEAGFTASELLAFYSAPGVLKLDEQVVGWVFASFVIADAIKHDVRDWGLEFDLFMNGFVIVRNRLDIEDAIHVFQRVFGN